MRRNTVQIPTVASFSRDIEGSRTMVRKLEEAGYNGGLMLIIRGGMSGVIGDEASKQIENLSVLSPEELAAPVTVMLSNLPIGEIDILNGDTAEEHVRRGIEFTFNLPFTGRMILTLHLNSLVSRKEFLSKSAAEWREEFSQTVAPRLRRIARFAADYGVEVKIETVPVPEFGDSISINDEREYHGIPLRDLRDLRNPFYLSDHWGFNEIRACGLGICLDLSHSRTLYQGQPEGLFPEEVDIFGQRSLLDDVVALDSSDIIHLNDGGGCFDADGGCFNEGVTLGEGDIKDLRGIIEYCNANEITMIIEVNETDYKDRPNTVKSINYIRGL